MVRFTRVSGNGIPTGTAAGAGNAISATLNGGISNSQAQINVKGKANNQAVFS